MKGKRNSKEITGKEKRGEEEGKGKKKRRLKVWRIYIEKTRCIKIGVRNWKRMWKKRAGVRMGVILRFF